MSELKAINLNSMGCYNINEPIYLKSEADKVIAHHKYKRCLAMALVWFERAENSTDWKNELVSRKRFSKWMKLAEKFKEAK